MARGIQIFKRFLTGSSISETLSPAVNHLIHKHQLDLTKVSQIPRTGPKNRLLKGDILNFLLNPNNTTVSINTGEINYSEVELSLENLQNSIKDKKVALGNAFLKLIQQAGRKSGLGSNYSLAMYSPVGIITPEIILEDSIKFEDIQSILNEASNSFLEKSNENNIKIYDLNMIKMDDLNDLKGSRIVICPFEYNNPTSINAIEKYQDIIFSRNSSSNNNLIENPIIESNPIDLFELPRLKKSLKSNQIINVKLELYLTKSKGIEFINNLIKLINVKELDKKKS